MQKKSQEIKKRKPVSPFIQESSSAVIDNTFMESSYTRLAKNWNVLRYKELTTISGYI